MSMKNKIRLFMIYKKIFDCFIRHYVGVSKQNNIELNKSSFNILGSCVMRDIWGFRNEIHDDSIKVFIQSNNPLTFITLPLSKITPECIMEKDMKSTNDVWYRWTVTNAEKIAFDRINSNPTDYILCNLTEIVNPILRIENDFGKYTYLEYQKGVRENDVFGLPKFNELKSRVISPYDLPKEYIDECLVYFEKSILKQYDPNHIIFFVNYPMTKYITAEGTLKKYKKGKEKQKNDLIKYANKHFIDNVSPNCIFLPRNAIGNEMHKWGLCDYHYIDEAYDYLFYALNILLGEGQKQDKQKRLKRLERMYRKFFDTCVKCYK